MVPGRPAGGRGMMISNWFWVLKQTLKQVWLRVVGFALLAVLTAAAAQVVAPFVPQALSNRIGAEAVDEVLDILASSMLAVTTFSISIAVSAFAAAASEATPRATRLLQQDRTTQNVLATFLGAFVFSLVGMIALQAGFYDGRGRLVLYLVTAGVVFLVVAALLRWISHLMRFGRMADTLDLVEAAAISALRRRVEAPYLGGTPLAGKPPAHARPLTAATVGYVQNVDLATLSKRAEELNADLYLAAMPGSFVHHAAPLLLITGGEPDATQQEDLRDAFACARDRTFDQDPRFGLIVLSEIASRALSPSVNDPGTAISVIGRLVRVLAVWHGPVGPKVVYPRVHVPAIAAEDMVVDAFRPIARDGAGLIEVQIRLQKALAAVGQRAPDVFGNAVANLSAEALRRSEAAGVTEQERAAILDCRRNLLEGIAGGLDGPTPASTEATEI